MKYVMSDIHGCLDKFLKILRLIKFSDSDEIYILGDVLDRGPNPLEVMDYVMSHENICMLKGNHELFFEDFYQTGDIRLWKYNGGAPTFNELQQRDQKYSDDLYNYVQKLPFIKVVDKYILTHAGVYFPFKFNELDIEKFISIQEEDYCLWDRSMIGDEKQYKDYYVIVGHTPTSLVTKKKKEKIVKRNGVIYIDCGGCFGGKLSCLRLDDMKEFYV